MNVIETSGLGKRYGRTWALKDAALAMGATRGTEVDRAITAAGGVLPDGPLLAGTASHPGLLVNASIAAVVVLGWIVLHSLLRPTLPGRAFRKRA